MPDVVPVPANDGLAPTPLNGGEINIVSIAAQFSPAVGHAAAALIDEAHVGEDFINLGLAAAAGQNPQPFANAAIFDLQQGISDYLAGGPTLQTGVGIAFPADYAILPVQTVVDLINTSIQALQAPPAPTADQEFGHLLVDNASSTMGALFGIPGQGPI